jgi:cation diffusion facilitator CzcD-associated flavoprotein CzcO
MQQHTVIVVGAGPAGLATAARLHRAGLRPVVLERADAVGASWRGRYDRLRLNSPRWYSTVPGGRWRPGTLVFPSRDDVVDHLETYAADEGIDVRFGVGVESIDRDGDAWLVATSAGDLRATDVVVATGHSNLPHMPAWPGRDRFAGLLLHAADYRSPGAYRGRDVLVVGAGSTGAEIAHDLVDGGAARVRLAVRTPPNIMLRAPVGAPLAAALARLPTPISDAVARFVRRRTVGDLTAYGLPVPAEGVFSRLRRLHVAPMIVDAEVLDAIRAGRIEIVAGVQALDDTGVLLAGGERIAPDTVIAATGYRTGLEPLVGHLGVLDDHGSPRVTGGEAAPGLRFVGFVPRPALLHALGREAQRAARGIARTRPAERPVRVDDRAWMGDFAS